MNNIITLSQLITRLARITDTDTTTARVFLRNFFSTIEQQLIAGQSVTVKGIGTFRRSEDPLAGAPHGVIFIPDSNLQDEVNRRFGVFQPVELAPGADDTILKPDIPEESAPEEEISAESEIFIPESDMQRPDPMDEEEPEPLDMGRPRPMDEQEPLDMGRPRPIDEPEQLDIDHPHPTDEQEAEPETEPAIPGANEEEPEPEHSNRNLIIWIIIAGLIIVGLAVAKAFYDNPVPKVGFYDDEEETETPAPDSTPAIEEVSIETLNSSATPEPEVKEIVSVQPVPVPTQSEPVYDTIRSNYFLAKMARKHYGAEYFWVYIYEANQDKLKGKHPDRLPADIRLLIPDKSTIPAIDNTAEAKRLAEAKSREIYARFK